MKLKYLSALIFGVVLSLPVQAQVYLDSTEVANILHPKAVTAVQPKVTSTANDVSEEEEDTDSIIPAFTTDSRLSWKENITARLDEVYSQPPYYLNIPALVQANSIRHRRLVPISILISYFVIFLF